MIGNVDRAREVFRCRSEVPDWCNVTLAYLGLNRLRYPYCLNLPGLHPVVLDEISDLWAFWQVFLRRVYSVSASDFLILDAGANIGLFTLLAARESQSSRIIALEPFPSTFRRLVENVNNNQMADRVTCLNIALGDSTELRCMDLIPQFSQRRHLDRQGAERKTEFVSVPTTTLARVLESHWNITPKLSKTRPRNSSHFFSVLVLDWSAMSGTAKVMVSLTFCKRTWHLPFGRQLRPALIDTRCIG